MISSYYAQQRILPENAPVGPLFLCISAIYFGYELLFPGERGIIYKIGGVRPFEGGCSDTD